MVCATSKASDQPAHTRSLIKAFAVPMQVEAPFVTNLRLEELFNTEDNANDCDPLTQFDDYKLVSET